MTAIKRAELKRRLAAPGQTRLFLFAGPDESASRELAGLALAALGDPADPMALSDLAPDELRADPGRLPDEAAAVSMFGERRVIRVLGAGDGCAAAARLLLDAPVAGNPVVMVAGDLGKASTLRKLAEESAGALVLISWPLRADELESWVEGQARALGLRLEIGVSDRLIARTGGETGVLASELQKFAMFLDAAPEAPRRLERSHLAALGADSADEDLNLLAMAVLCGRAAAVEAQLRLLRGGSSIPVMRALARRLLQLAEARAAVDAGAKPLAATRALRPPIFWNEVDAFADAIRHWPQPRIRRGLALMLQGEQAIKQVAGPGEAAGWQAIVRLGMGRESA